MGNGSTRQKVVTTVALISSVSKRLQEGLNMNNEITLRYIGYVRKSSEDNKERQAASIPEQIYELEKLKEKDKLNIIETVEESQTAHKPGRPVFNKLLDRIGNGEANGIVIWHENRLSRNAYDAGQVVYLMDLSKLVEVRTPARVYKNTPGDKFMLQIELATSKKDSDDKSIAVKRGLEKKLRDGWRPGEVPQGYLNDKREISGFRKIHTDPDRLPFIKQIFEMFDSGTSVKEIRDIAEDEWKYRTIQKKREGGKPLSLSMMYAILKNPFYIGRFEYPVGSDNWYEGKHEKAISEELFERVQIKLGNRSQYKLTHHDYAYTALMKCGHCGSGIVAEQKNQAICSNCKLKFSLTKDNREKCTRCGTRIADMQHPKILHYIYYRCGRKKRVAVPCKQKSLEVNKLETLVDKMLEQIEISPLFMNWAIKQIKKMHEDERNFREDAIAAVKRAHDACRSKLDNLLHLKISPENRDGSLIDDEQYKIERHKLEAELRNLEQQLGTVDTRMLQVHDDTVKAVTFATRAQERFAAGDHTVKRDIFMGLGSHLRLFDKQVLLDSPKYLFILKKMKQDAPVIAERVAPELESVMATKMEALYASIPSLLRSQESHLV